MIIFKTGDAGTLVEIIQTKLMQRGLFPPGAVGGDFGSITEKAVKTFQENQEIRPDGIVGAQTLKLLELNFDAFKPNGKDKLIDWILPESGAGFWTYNREAGGRDQFGRKTTIDKITKLAFEWNKTGGATLQFGDMSRRHGGKFPPHATHQDGRAVDVRPLRKDGALKPTDCRTRAEYDKDATRDFCELVKALFPGTKILFNDPKLIAKGLTRFCSGHSNHLHLQF